MTGSDKCVSCNQNLSTNNKHHNYCITEQYTTNSGTKQNKNLKTKTKYLDKLKNITTSAKSVIGGICMIKITLARKKSNLNSIIRILTLGKVKI